MSYKILRTAEFTSEIKRLSKKYHSLKKDFVNFLNSLTENPTQGTPLGNSCFKIRIAIASKGKGKSGGVRIITCVFMKDEVILLVGIYDKSERSSITEKEINERLKRFARSI